MALLCLCPYLPVSSPFPLLLAACSSSILTPSLSYTKQTAKAGSRTLHPADMPYQQQTPPPTGCFFPLLRLQKENICILPPTVNFPISVKGRAFLPLAELQADSATLCCRGAPCLQPTHAHSSFYATCNVSSISYRAATNEYTANWLIAQVSNSLFSF